MTAKKPMVAASVITITLVVAVILVFVFVKPFESKEEKSALDLFEAQMTYIGGDDSGLKDSGYYEDYETSVNDFYQTYAFNDSQKPAFEKAHKEFEYKVDDVTSKEKDGKTTVTITYEVDVYPILDPATQDEFFENPEKYLTEEELEKFNNGTDEEKRDMGVILITKYHESLSDIKPETQKYSVSYVVDKDGKVEFALGNSMEVLIGTVVGMNTDKKIEE